MDTSLELSSEDSWVRGWLSSELKLIECLRGDGFLTVCFLLGIVVTSSDDISSSEVTGDGVRTLRLKRRTGVLLSCFAERGEVLFGDGVCDFGDTILDLGDTILDLGDGIRGLGDEATDFGDGVTDFGDAILDFGDRTTNFGDCNTPLFPLTTTSPATHINTPPNQFYLYMFLLNLHILLFLNH